jgi:phosphoribosylanthranilate isomerase
VDALGFVCVESSKRFVPIEGLRPLVQALTPWVTPVLLFVNPECDAVDAALEWAPHALLQFHGQETPEFCARFRRPYIKAGAASSREDLLKFIDLHQGAGAILVDTPSPGHGGSGLTFDWSRVPPASERALPLILAGGLTPENVASAMHITAPYGVDVSSGIETAPGVKCAERMAKFMAAVATTDARLGAV